MWRPVLKNDKTILKGGGLTASREANVHPVWQKISGSIIDQCVAQGVPFAREYGGLLDNRSFWRCPGPPYLLCQGPDRANSAAGGLQRHDADGAGGGHRSLLPAEKMLDLVVINGQARGINRPQPGDWGIRALRRRCRAALHRRLRQCVLPLYQRQKL